MKLYNRIEAIRAQIKQLCPFKPIISFLSGTGLGAFSSHLEDAIHIPYAQLQHFPQSVEVGHSGHLTIGRFNDHILAVFEGRFHLYQGYTMDDICMPVYVAKSLGCSQLWMTNLSGGLQDDMQAGDLVALSDHLNLQFNNPLIGVNDTRLGPRFPDMSSVYSKHLRTKALNVFHGMDLPYREGIYACFRGPSLETRAEYAFLQTIGADLVGMSTVPEATVASYLRMDVFCLSMVSNVCAPVENIKPVDVQRIMELANERSQIINRIFMEMLNRQI